MLISHVDLHHAATFADLFWWSDANTRNWWLLIADGLDLLRFDYGGYFEVRMGNYSILNIATVMRLWPSRCVYCAKKYVSWHLSTQTCQEENLAINGILLTNYHFHPFSLLKLRLSTGYLEACGIIGLPLYHKFQQSSSFTSWQWGILCITSPPILREVIHFSSSHGYEGSWQKQPGTSARFGLLVL